MTTSARRPLGVGIAGFGWMGRVHTQAYSRVLHHFPQLAVAPQLVAVTDAVPGRAAAAAEQFGFAKATRDWHEVAADPDVAAVSITAPNFLHREIGVAMARTGKHIWIEKPVGLTADDARAVAEAVREAGVAGEVDAVGGQVAQHPAAAALPLEAPAQCPLGVRGVVAEQPEPDVGDPAELPAVDHRLGRGDGRGVAVVEPDRPRDPGLPHRRRNGPRVVGGEAHRLLDPDVLAGPRHRDADLAVQEVGRGDAHRGDVRVGRHLAPVPRRPREPELRGGLLGAPRHRVGDRDQLRGHRELREVVQDPAVGLGVHPAHPAEPGDPHPERAAGGRRHRVPPVGAGPVPTRTISAVAARR